MGAEVNNSVGDDIPVHEVSISGFEMSSKEITNIQYATFLNKALESGDVTVSQTDVIGARGEFSGQNYFLLTGSQGAYKNLIQYVNGLFVVNTGMQDYPVICVTWYGAQAYALYYDSDLPTEAEWEYACRGGKQYLYGTYDGTLSNDKANFGGYLSNFHPTRVGSYRPNPFGLYDMLGNVFEMCKDWYLAGYYGISPRNNPQGPESGEYRVLRGGGFDTIVNNQLRAYGRGITSPNFVSPSNGFRVVRHTASSK